MFKNLLLIIVVFSLQACCTKKKCRQPVNDTDFTLQFSASIVQEPDSVWVTEYNSNGTVNNTRPIVSGGYSFTSDSSRHLLYIGSWALKEYTYRVVSKKYNIDCYFSDFEVGEYVVEEKDCNTCFPYKPMREYRYSRLEGFKVNSVRQDGNLYAVI